MQITTPNDDPNPHADSIPHLAQTQQISDDIARVNRVAGDLMLRFIGHGLTAAEQVIDLVDKKSPSDKTSTPSDV